MDAETRRRFGFGVPAERGAIEGYMSDSTAVRVPNWAMRGDIQIFETVEDEEDDVNAQASALRQLTGVAGASVHLSTKHRTANPVSWTDLEVSCRKLDAAQIRISSVDLTCMEEEEDFMNQAPDFEEIPEEEFQSDTSTDDTSASSGATQKKVYPPIDPDAVEVSYSFSLPSSNHEEEALLCESAAALAQGAPLVCQRSPAGALAAPSPMLTSSPTSSDSNSKSFARIPSTGGSSFTSSPASSVASRRPMTAYAGDIIGSPGVPSSASAMAVHVSLAGLQAGPERTTSGVWNNPPRGVLGGTRLKQAGPASFPGQPQSRVTEPRLAQDVFQAMQTPKETPYTKYSSLILPGAVPRDARANVGVRKYIRAVRTKCGEIFSSSSVRKGKVQS